ncbi:acyltransferase [Burkholderia sp. 4M9327F10]|jgi:peptidoglycan/LPS O-acetylase OafA/YrhL|uniref:acyltransferase family protein n=1 Tax=Burkholderia sp. 4M9327F10 TaxID=2502223 RepID=UPI0010F8B7EF|nr:acyltransferase [Burkholderia sp. 4M9327F10]
MPPLPVYPASTHLKAWPALISSKYSKSRSLREVIESHENNYTLIRAFLAASVIYFHSFHLVKADGYADHLSGALSPITQVGGLAVQAFFFLSGLFVTQSFCRDPSIRNFIIKRVLRIWPGYFVCLAITALLCVAASTHGKFLHYLVFDGFYKYILSNSIFHFTWEINGIFTTHQDATINGSIHTLPLEAKMYVVLGCMGLLGMLSKAYRIVLAGFALIALAFVPAALNSLPINLFDEPYSRAAGVMFLAGVITFGAANWIKPRLWQGAAFAILTAITSSFLHLICFYLAVIWVLLYLGQMSSLAKFVRPRQDLSYGIYLYGFPCQQMVLSTTTPHLNPYALTVASLALASILAAASWRFIEEPAIALGKTLSKVKFTVLRTPRLKIQLPTARETRVSIGIAFLLLACIAMKFVAETYDLVPVVPMQTHLVDFGPKQSKAGNPINPQPDGSSAIWIKLDSTPSADTMIVFAGRQIQTQIDSGFATGTVDADLLKHAGDKSLFLEYRTADQIQRSNVQTLHVVR